jgi:hypothetical protein
MYFEPKPNFVMDLTSSLVLANQRIAHLGCSRVETFINAYKRLNTDKTFFWYGGLSSWLIVFKDEKWYKHGDIY